MDNNLKDKLGNKLGVRVIEDKCIGCGGCEAIASANFRVSSKGLAEVISEDGEDEDKMLAAQSCPTGAIEVVEKESGIVKWPMNKSKGGGK